LSKCTVLLPTHRRVIATEKTLKSLSDCASRSIHKFEVILSNNNGHDLQFKTEITRIGEEYGATVVSPPQFLESGNDHLLWLIEAINSDADWFWFFGDDDSPLPTANEEADQLMSMSELDYIHATDSKIRLCSHTDHGSLKHLARKYGVMELFSFWSSQIISKALLESLRGSLRQQEIRACLTNPAHPSAAFAMSVLLLHAGATASGAVMASPAVEAAHTPSELSGGDAWVWFQLDKHFDFLVQQNLLRLKEPRTVFYHHKQPMWIKQTLWLLRPVIEGRPVRIAELLEGSLRLLSFAARNDQTVAEEVLLRYVVATANLAENSSAIYPTPEYRKILLDLYQGLNEIGAHTILDSSATVRPTCNETPETSKFTFIQIGAGAGDLDPRALNRDGFSEEVKNKYSTEQIARIILVEPNPFNHKALMESWKEFPNAEFYGYAITTKERSGQVVSLYFEERDGPHFQVASLNLPHVINHYPPPHTIRKLEVKTISLEHFLNELKCDSIELLALDIEGIDGEVVLDTDFSRFNINNISIETFHLGPLRESVTDHLNKCGFRESGAGINHSGILDRMFTRIKN